MPVTPKDRATKALVDADKAVVRAQTRYEAQDAALTKAGELRDAAKAALDEAVRLRDYAASHPTLSDGQPAVLTPATEVAMLVEDVDLLPEAAPGSTAPVVARIAEDGGALAPAIDDGTTSHVDSGPVVPGVSR